MIQDIDPARFDNVYKDRRPDKDSLVCYFKEGELLARCDEEKYELIFPRYTEFPEGTDAIYMFSIDAQAFFLVLEAEALPPEEAGAADVRIAVRRGGDSGAALDRLFRTLADSGLPVRMMREEKENLEEIFLRVVGY